MDLGSDERRLVVEILSTMVNSRRGMAEKLLKPAGVSAKVYGPLLTKVDTVEERKLYKREIAEIVVQAIELDEDRSETVRAIIDLAANWQSFHLASEEYKARGVSQKAREFLNLREEIEDADRLRREDERRRRTEQLQSELRDDIHAGSSLLLSRFDGLYHHNDHQRRGYDLQDLLGRVFQTHGISLARPFTRNEGSEQIDGAFKLDGWYYIVECRWRQALANIRELDGLSGQLDRSGPQTLGLFLSIEGWSKNVPVLLKQSPRKNIFLANGIDLRTTLSEPLDLRKVLSAKLEALNVRCEPYLPVQEFIHSCCP